MEQHCLICKSHDLNIYESMCLDFLAERMFNSASFPVKLYWCNECGFAFFIPRPTDEEAERFYTNYRDEQYLRQRQKFEPWYTEEFHNALNGAGGHKPDINYNLVRNVFDYGGGDGSYVAGLGIPDMSVYDLSNVPLLPGVKRISAVDDYTFYRWFDLITCCHVLEHVTDPHEILNNIMRYATRETKIYLEVPDDSFRALSNPFFKMAIDIGLLTSERFRIFAKNRFLRMTEHINFFTPKSLRLLMELHGIMPVVVERKQDKHAKYIVGYGDVI